MTDLQSAINDLKAELAAHGYRPGVVTETAEDWDLVPVFLRRKFHEATGQWPVDYVPPRPVEVDYGSLWEERKERGQPSWSSLSERDRENFRRFLSGQPGAKGIYIARR